MRRLLFFILYGFLMMAAASFIGCATTKPTAKITPAAGAAGFPPYSGPKARIVVADFEVKASKATGEIGAGLREMLVTALMNSNRFSVLERQALGAVMREQELSASGAAQPGTEVPRGQIKTADLIVTAAVTEFEPQASGGVAGVGGGGGVGSGILGGILGAALTKAHMALDIRIVDSSTSEVVEATRVQGEASDIAGGFMTGFIGGWGLGAGLGAYSNTPMEKAIRICIIEAVRHISDKIPQDYYKYKQ